MRSFFYSVVIGSLLVSACGDGGSGPENGPPSTITAVSSTTLDGQAGTALQPISVKVSDASGRPVPRALVHFTIPLGGGSLSAPSDTTDEGGVASVTWTLGQTVGPSRAEARVAGVLVPAVFNATIRAGAPTAMQRVSNPPGSSAAGFELADSVAVRITDNFGNPIANSQVAFAVTSGGGAVSPATATTNPQGVARAAWQLGSSGAQQLRATAGAIQATVDATAAACTSTQIAVGSVLTIGPADPKCVVLSGNASRYFVTVVNAAPSAGSLNAFRMRGLSGSSTTATGDVVTAPTAVPFGGLGASARATLEQVRAERDGHDLIRRANERVLQEQLPKLAAARAALRANSMQASVVPPNVGDIVTLRVPNVNNLCSTSGSTMVGARVVFVGQHGVMLEDTLSPTRGQLDSLYTLVGQEFDTSMWTLLNDNFGNPLAMDAQTDNNQRFYMLFSQIVNNLQGGQIAGFVASSDFFPQSTCPGSNLAEIFYARVPTVTGGGTGAGTVADWYRRTRTVMIHEVKHIVSFAERFARGFSPTNAFNNEDRWLEESSAMMAEELWARTVYGYQPKSNVTYAQSVGCEVRAFSVSIPVPPECVGKPLSMFDHFILLYDYESNNEGLSPIGASANGDFTFYGSGWSFLRWVIDTYGTSESAFLSAMVRDFANAGVANIETRTGRPFADLVNDWAVALIMDDYPGFTPGNTKHQIVSWKVPDIFAGMSADFSNQNFFTDPTPLRTRATSFGKFSVDVSSVRGGSMAVFEVTGTQAGSQLFEFNGQAGTSFPADMRVNIIRVQ